MAAPTALKLFTSPARRFDASVDADNVRANDNALGTKINEAITEITAVEGATAPNGLSPFLLMGG